MAAIAEVLQRVIVVDANGGLSINCDPQPKRFSAGVGNGQRQTISLTALSNNTVTVPSGAKHCHLILGTGVSLTLKGASGDTGIALTPSSNPTQADASFPVSGVSTFVIYNGSGSAQSVEALFC